MRRVGTALISVAMAAATTACVTETKSSAPVLAAIEVPLGTDTRPIAFRRIVLKAPRHKPIGEVRTGIFCIKESDLRVRGGRYSLNDDMFTDVFRERLRRYNYRLVGNPDALFEDQSLAGAEFMVAGLIRDIEANACFPNVGFGDFSRSTAAAYLKVEWQLFNTLTRQVVYTTTTDGSDKVVEIMEHSLELALENAFATAVQNLLADQKFHAYLLDKPSTPEATGEAELEIPELNRNARAKFDPVSTRPGVVTIRTGSGHGSGFLISRRGYILTNQHVVGEARNVRVILHSGREIPGEVLRRDSRRDVALVKTSDEGLDSLPLNFKELPVGNDVLVYGTPLQEGLHGTLTKGIISAYRVNRQLRFIQSDANVQPGNSGGPMLDPAGNAIAITVSGISIGGNPLGHNFFIPINDAFKALKLKIPRGVPQS